jgi:hypothetical protein
MLEKDWNENREKMRNELGVTGKAQNGPPILFIFAELFSKCAE